MLENREKNEFTMITQKWKNHEDHLAMLQHIQLSRIFMEKNSCCVFGGISLVSCITSCSNRTKQFLGLSTEHNWWDWVEHSRKSAPTTTPDTTKLFSCMIMLVHMLRRRSKPIWKHSRSLLPTTTYIKNNTPAFRCSSNTLFKANKIFFFIKTLMLLTWH